MSHQTTFIVVVDWLAFMAWIVKEIRVQLRKPRSRAPKVSAREKYQHDSVTFE